MGQSKSSEAEQPAAEELAASRRYEYLKLEQLEKLVRERRIPLDGQWDRALLQTLLMAFDAGRNSATASEAGSSDVGSASELDLSLQVLRKIRDAPGHMGVDIGGTLVKMAVALPVEAAEDYSFPASFGETGRTHHHLELLLRASGELFIVRFVSGSTHKMEQAIANLGLQRNASKGKSEVQPRARSFQGATAETELANERSPTPWNAALESKSNFPRQFSDWSDAGEASFRPVRRIAAAGGGAFKFAPLFRDSLRVEMCEVKELSAVVDGLLLLATCSTGSEPDANSEESGGESPASSPIGSLTGPTSLFTVNERGESVPLPWPDPLFPLLLVNMGSGVSILRVDSANRNDFVRVGGTACGGGTFLGLARALTSAETFEEALALAAQGDAKRADKLVSDIYGNEGSASLGLSGNLTASNFGKLCDVTDIQKSCSEQDLARSLLQMVTQQSVLLASALAGYAGCIGRVFFVGGFVDEVNYLARVAIASNFRALGGCAYFLRHSDFLGALGSLQQAFKQLEMHCHVLLPPSASPASTPASAPVRR